MTPDRTFREGTFTVKASYRPQRRAHCYYAVCDCGINLPNTFNLRALRDAREAHMEAVHAQGQDQADTSR
jgi:hypothetical protein